MRPLSTAELLNAWEQALGQPPLWQAMTLLAAASPEVPLEELARLPIGQRDACLLTLREWVFGPQLVGLAVCPACGARVELGLPAAELRAPAEAGGGPLIPSESADRPPFQLVQDGYCVRYRLPNSQDLWSVADQITDDGAERAVLNRCLLGAEYGGTPIEIANLPPSVCDKVVEAMAAADPQADLQFFLACPACQQPWSIGLDLVSFFWQEIHAWAERILREVSQLAAAYGWHETEILAMSPTRRQAYLQLAAER